MSCTDILSHVVAYLEPCVTFHIQNPVIFRILKYLECEIYSIKTYSGIFRILRNARMLRTVPYLELLEFWHISDPRYISEFCQTSEGN